MHFSTSIEQSIKHLNRLILKAMPQVQVDTAEKVVMTRGSNGTDRNPTYFLVIFMILLYACVSWIKAGGQQKDSLEEIFELYFSMNEEIFELET